MLRWGSTPVTTSRSTIIEESSSSTISINQQHHDETSNSSPEPQEPTGALLVDDETDDEENGNEIIRSRKGRGDKRKRSREDDICGSDQVELDDDDDEADSEDKHPAWHPQNIQSTTEFTHIITDYANKRESGCKKAEYSEITVDDHGNRWRLIIYVNGNGRASNHHLSLFLQVADAEDLPFGWKKSVSYVLTLEHPNGATFSYAKRNPDKTFKLCPKAIDWGWSQFITSDRIQQEGFVSNDSLRVRASVTVKSSLVSIDEEDSELYLKCAVEEGDADAVELCLENGASVNCQFKDDLYTPLHTACSSGSSTGSMEVLEILLERGADCNACNKWRETPLLIAANNGHRLGVAALLKHGADPSLCSEAGWSALTFAAHKGYDDIVALLLRAGAPVNSRVSEDLSTPLHKACAGAKPGHLASVKLLLDASADPHALNKWRETPLLTAANHGQPGAVEVLLSSGADPCKCTDTGWSPLSIAAYKGHDDVVRLLLEEGAPTEEDDPTLSALLQAATKGLPDTVELLLRHGADHTVTTKKGDTALSILVEQNLIDAAVEMVTNYNASIPRCSRDRKKVQRARLLINLRMKQLEREGKHSLDDDEEDESENDGERETTLAQHVANGFHPEPQPQPNKRSGKSKLSAEEKAKAAEEELLQELAKEEEEARKEEAEATKKQAKKRKKKERERQQRLKEERERREKEEKEEREREQIRQEREDMEKRERVKRMNEEKEREIEEMMKREKNLQEKRKVKERRERQKQREEKTLKDPPLSPRRQGQITNTATENKGKTTKPKKSSVAPALAVSSNAGDRQGKSLPFAQQALDGNRRWETKGKTEHSLHSSKTQTVKSYGENRSLDRQVASDANLASWYPPAPSATRLPPPAKSEPSDNIAAAPLKQDIVTNGIHQKTLEDAVGIEQPSVVVRRKNKVDELLKRAELVQDVLSVNTLKRIIGRWIARASHGEDPFLDPIIPSWTDAGKGAAFFQRQFISESRRLDKAINMEALKAAGAAFSALCQELALDVSKFSKDVKNQSGPTWTDSSQRLSYRPQDCHNANETISWEDNYEVSFSEALMDVLRKRYKGPTGRILSALFAVRVHEETMCLILSDTGLDLRLSPRTQSVLATEMEVSFELYSNPVVAFPHNAFFGSSGDLDQVFGGMKPFTKDECAHLRKTGGSCSVLLPCESTVASQYFSRMLELIQEASVREVPLSFTVFVTSLSLQDPSREISRDELRLLDGRIESVEYVSEIVPRSEHDFWSIGVGECYKPSSSNTLVLVLQSDQGKQRFAAGGSSLSKVVQSMVSSSFHERRSPPPVLMEPFQPNFSTAVTPAPSPYFLSPESPFGRDVFTDGDAISQLNAAPSDIAPPTLPFDLGRGALANTRRGRLFDLVDNDVEEDNSVDIVAGMLDKLDVGLFDNSSGIGGSDVDIEAISLMGINGAPRASSSSYGCTSPNPFD